jgi:predicted metal-dependent RNase
MSTPVLTFVVGAGTVAGSKHLLGTGQSRVLIDCGLFQGLRALRGRNWDRPPFSWQDLDAVVRTHAHLDHCGYLAIRRTAARGGSVLIPAFAVDRTEIMLAWGPPLRPLGVLRGPRRGARVARVRGAAALRGRLVGGRAG